MMLSLLVTGLVYVLGVFVMVSLIEPGEFANDLAPAATAVKQLFHWLPEGWGTYLMTGAAMAAFASTGNAGLLSTSRYPFAMSRDTLFPKGFAKVGKSGTPYPAILDRKSTRLNSSHVRISYAVFCLKKKKTKQHT